MSTKPVDGPDHQLVWLTLSGDAETLQGIVVASSEASQASLSIPCQSPVDAGVSTKRLRVIPRKVLTKLATLTVADQVLNSSVPLMLLVSQQAVFCVRHECRHPDEIEYEVRISTLHF